MSDILKVGAIVDPEHLQNEVEYTSNNNTIKVDSDGLITSTTGDDADVALTAHVRSVRSSDLNMKLVNVSDFKYDLITLDYNKDEYSITRDTSGNTSILTFMKLKDTGSNIICNIYYPVSMDMNIEIESEAYTLIKVEDECIYQLASKHVLATGVYYSVHLLLTSGISNLNRYIIDGGSALDDY